MVRRRGLGATMAASVAFSVLLASALVVYAASVQRAGVYSSVESGDSLADEFRAIELAEATDILLGVQGLLATGAMACPSAPAGVGSSMAELSESQGAGNLTVVASVSPAAGDRADNLSGLQPYAGSVAGDVDMLVAFSGSGAGVPGVSFDRTEAHYVHLGSRLTQESADCTSAVSEVEAELQGTAVANCTDELVGSALTRAEAGPASKAASDGFGFSLTYEILPVGGCLVTFKVTLVQPGIPGPAGDFNVLVAEAGAAVLETSSRSQA